MSLVNFITGNKFKRLADDFLDQSKPYIDLTKKPQIIFLYTDWVDAFKQQILPNIRYRFKLITHNADEGVYQKDLDLLEDDRLIRWYGMNCHIEHSKLTQIPIGIANEQWPHGDEELLREIAALNIPKNNRVYCNFNPATNPERLSILRSLENNPFVDIEQDKLDQKSYWSKLASYKYVISPPGNSVDCHRIWESLYLNTVPICLNSIELKSFESAGILFVDSYSNLPLQETNITINSSFCDFDFWRKKL